MNTATITLHESFLSRRNALDWIFAALVVAGGLFAFSRYASFMDVYEKGILLGTMPAAIWLGWFWRPLRVLMLAVAAFSLLAVFSYDSSLANAEKVFWLKYFLSSQSAILWMSMLFFMSTAFYWIGMFSRGQGPAMMRIGSRIAWVAVALALIGTMVRWYESYQIGPDIGHIPVSNLYEVFVLFCWMTALFYLYFEEQYATRSLGAFVMLVVSAAVGFLLWYTFDREAQHIQPLVPALQSYWMKIHVPANFIGYGAFSLAAMLGVVYLLAQPQQAAPALRRVLWPAGALLVATGAAMVGWTFTHEEAAKVLRAWALLPVTAGLLVWVVAGQGRMADRLPAPAVVDNILYKSIALGFAAFTVATILGALWAAEAWGGYWSWDPKETWALIVWLNYAAWLHLRLTKGLRGPPMAWWAIIGLFVTAFAFLGVNMWLSGLHSYGTL